jgi:hypothetical protein
VSHVNQSFNGVLNNDIVEGTCSRSFLNIEDMERGKQEAFVFLVPFRI